MVIDYQEQANECRINSYEQWLYQLRKKVLLEYFKDMEIKTLIEFIKEEYGNDGCDDCNFES